MHETAFQIFVNALLANNFVLAMFLGLCPFLGVSGKLNTAFPMGVATTFVMIVASLCAYGLNLLLTAYGLEYLRLISYIVIIASAVQLVEMVLKKYSPALFRALGIYLPLITTNCAVLGVALVQTARDYDFVQCGIAVDRLYARFARRNPELGPFRKNDGSCGCCAAREACAGREGCST
ncbi:MAG: electron transport complex subunit A [Rhodocyclales bacterium]|nr:electron transport complex subunit A [Rhodocyclales bacterium]